MNKNKHSVPINFSVDTAPLSMKKGLLIAELKRSIHKHTKDETLNKHFSEIKNKYLAQQYPQKLIENSIEKVKKDKKEDSVNWKQEKEDFPERNFTCILPFTSKRVSKVTSELRKLIKSFLPEFNLHTAHRTLSIRNSIISNLVPKNEEANTTNAVYSFRCKCYLEYIGETENLNKRVQEHQQPGETQQCSNIFKNVIHFLILFPLCITLIFSMGQIFQMDLIF
jgi:hypothetical protein